MKEVLEKDYDAVFVGTGRLKADYSSSGHEEVQDKVQIGIEYLANVLLNTPTKSAKGDCAGWRKYGHGLLPYLKRLGGEEVTVVVRSP
ncbi:MAG: hypothetical protein R3B47_10025 [Bacteroidia bacterium]